MKVPIRSPPFVKVLMRLAIGGGALVIAIVALSLIRPDIVSFQIGPFVAHCDEDGEIPAAERPIIDGEASDFVRDILGNDVDRAYAQLSRLAKATTSKQQLQSAEQTIRSDGPYGPIAITRSYLIRLRWGRGSGQTIACDSDKDAGGGDLPKLGAEPKQANIVVVTSNPKGKQSFTVWLDPDGDSWRVRGFHYQPVTTTGTRP